ncbi:hypothetical protein M3P05_04045 [Sansalvadorimonas sp. 2012CJ34-2]|uniref:Uncharacterized protein n=1 Tax=Parendozoicomonas callyspongiae TaxID=2942213 RepID=A0ABT0PF01_9GAMM|nr:hypothetical protein [Sansalvadorimonas sp. 2012CJ34-2]MCL6269113.1 hypothetical protein [Sansalvadorimonas sp. 2012CJ34-2]
MGPTAGAGLAGSNSYERGMPTQKSEDAAGIPAVRSTIEQTEQKSIKYEESEEAASVKSGKQITGNQDDSEKYGKPVVEREVMPDEPRIKLNPVVNTTPAAPVNPVQYLQEAKECLNADNFQGALDVFNSRLNQDFHQLSPLDQYQAAYIRLQAMLKVAIGTTNTELIKALATFNDISQELLWQQKITLAKLQSQNAELLCLMRQALLQPHTNLTAEVFDNEEVEFVKIISKPIYRGLTIELTSSQCNNHGWTNFWKGLASFRQNKFGEAKEHFRKAHKREISQAAPWLALCIMSFAHGDMTKSIENRPLDSNPEEAKKELLLAVELGEPAACVLLEEKEKIASERGKTKERNDYHQIGSMLGSASCCCGLAMAKAGVMFSMDMQISKGNVPEALDYLLMAKQAYDRRIACPAIPSHPILLALNIPNDKTSSPTDSQRVMNGDEILMKREFLGMNEHGKTMLPKNIYRILGFGCSQQFKEGIEELTKLPENKMNMHWAACLMGLLSDDDHNHEQALRILDRYSLNFNQFTADAAALIRNSRSKNDRLAAYRAECTYKRKMAEEFCSKDEIDGQKHERLREHYRQHLEARGYLHKAYNEVYYHEQPYCCRRGKEITYRSLILGRVLYLPFQRHGSLEGLAENGFPPACMLLARIAIEENKEAPDKWLSNLPLATLPEAELLKSFYHGGQKPSIQRVLSNINSCFRYLDLYGGTKDGDTFDLKNPHNEKVLKHFRQFATEAECRLLRTDPGASPCALRMKSYAESCSDPCIAIDCLYRAFWMTGDCAIAASLTNKLQQHGRPIEALQVERVVCNEYREKNLVTTYKSPDSNLEFKYMPIYTNQSSNPKPPQLPDEKKEKEEIRQLFQDVEEATKITCYLEHSNKEELLELYEQYSILAERVLAAKDVQEIEEKDQQLVGQLFYCLGMVCHYLKRTSEAGDFLILAAEKYACAESYFPAAVYCWDRNNTLQAKNFVDKAPDGNALVEIWKKELNLQYNLIDEWTDEACTKPDDFDTFLEKAEELAKDGNAAGFSYMLRAFHMKITQEEQSLPYDDSARTWALSRHEMLQRRILAMKSPAILPMLFNSLFVGNSKLFPLSPYRLLNVLRDVKAPKCRTPLLLSGAHDSEHMIKAMNDAPITQENWFFEMIINGLYKDAENDYGIYMNMLQLNGVLADTPYFKTKFLDTLLPSMSKLNPALLDFAKGQLSECGEKLAKVLKAKGDSPDNIKLLVCQLHVYSGSHQLSDEELKSHLKELRGKGYSCAGTCQGILDLNKGQRQNALSHFLKAATCSAFDPEAAHLAALLKLKRPCCTEGRKLLTKAVDVSYEPALCLKAVGLIKDKKFDEALKIVDVPWLQNHPEAIALKTWIQWQENQSDQELCQALKKHCSSENPQVLFRLLTLSIHSPSFFGEIDVPSVIISLLNSLDSASLHFLQADPDLTVVNDYLRITIIEEDMKSAADGKSQISLKMKAEQLICKLNPSVSSETIWTLPSGRLLETRLTECATQLYEKIMEEDCRQMHVQRKNLETIYQGTPKVINPEHCYQIALKHNLASTKGRSNALHWLTDFVSDSDIETLLDRALNEAYKQHPVKWAWIGKLAEKLASLDYSGRHEGVNSGCIEILLQCIKRITKGAKADEAGALLHLLNYIKGSKEALDKISDTDIVDLIERCQKEPSCQNLTIQMAELLDSRMQNNEIDKASKEFAQRTAEVMYKYYRGSKKDKACSWLFYMEGDSAVLRVQAELAELLKNNPPDKAFIQTVYQTAKRTFHDFPGVKGEMVAVAMDYAVEDGDKEWLNWLDGMQRKVSPCQLKPKTCVALSCLRISEGQNVDDVFQQLLVPQMTGSSCYDVLDEVIQCTLVKNTFPEEYFNNFIYCFEESGNVGSNKSREQMEYIDRIQKDQLQDFVVLISRETNQERRVARLLRCGEKHPRSLLKLETSSVLEIYREAEAESKCHDAALTILFQRFEKQKFDEAICLHMVRYFSKKLQKNQSKSQEQYLSVCETLTEKEETATLVFETLDEIVDKFSHSYQAKITAIKERCWITYQLSKSVHRVIPELLKECDDLLEKEDEVRGRTEIEGRKRLDLIKRMELWIKHHKASDLHYSKDSLDEKIKRLNSSAQSIEVREKLDAWETEKDLGAKLRLTDELMKIDAEQYRLSDKDRKNLSKLSSWKDEEIAKVNSMIQQLKIGYPDIDLLKMSVETLKQLPESFPEKACLTDAISTARESKISYGIKTSYTLLEQLKTTRSDNTQARESLDEQEQILENLSDLLPSKLDKRLSQRYQKMLEVKKNVLNAVAFKEYLSQKTTMLLQMESFQESIQNMKMDDLDRISVTIKDFMTEDESIGITADVLAEKHRLQNAITLYRAGISLYQHKDCETAFAHLIQLQEDGALPVIINQYALNGYELVWTVCDQVIKAQNCKSKSKRHYQQCELLLQTVVGSSKDTEDKARVRLAQFYESTDFQDKAKIEWTRLLDSSDPFVQAAIPEKVKGLYLAGAIETRVKTTSTHSPEQLIPGDKEDSPPQAKSKKPKKDKPDSGTRGSVPVTTGGATPPKVRLTPAIRLASLDQDLVEKKYSDAVDKMLQLVSCLRSFEEQDMRKLKEIIVKHETVKNVAVQREFKSLKGKIAPLLSVYDAKKLQSQLRNIQDFGDELDHIKEEFEKINKISKPKHDLKKTLFAIEIMLNQADIARDVKQKEELFFRGSDLSIDDLNNISEVMNLQSKPSETISECFPCMKSTCEMAPYLDWGAQLLIVLQEMKRGVTADGEIDVVCSYVPVSKRPCSSRIMNLLLEHLRCLTSGVVGMIESDPEQLDSCYKDLSILNFLAGQLSKIKTEYSEPSLIIVQQIKETRKLIQECYTKTLQNKHHSEFVPLEGLNFLKRDEGKASGFELCTDTLERVCGCCNFDSLIHSYTDKMDDVVLDQLCSALKEHLSKYPETPYKLSFVRCRIEQMMSIFYSKVDQKYYR